MSKANTKANFTTKSNDNYVLVIVTEGFYFFGREIKGAEGYITIVEASMSGGFQGGKGIFGVVRGDKEAKITLDCLAPDQKAAFPINSVVGIVDSVNLYTLPTTTIR